MTQIVDPYGNPIRREQLAEPQTSRLGHLHREWAEHPSRGLTPAKLARVLEEAEQGDLKAQCELFEDMEEKDAHIFAEMSKRKRALLTVDWDIVPPRGATAQEEELAAYAREVIADLPDFEDALFDLLDAIGKGFSCLEITWGLAGREWLPKALEYRPQSWFRVHPEHQNELRLRDHTPEGARLQPFGWIVHTHKAKSGYLARGGLSRVLAWPFLFKNYSVRDLAEFLEIYGLPLRLGTYPSGATDKEKATLLQAVIGIGHSAAGIIPEGMAIEFKEAAKGSHDPFQAMMAWCEASQSKAILGGTLTSQTSSSGGGAYALGQVHNEVRHDLMVSDARQLAGTLTRDLVYPILALNRGGVDNLRRLPRFRFEVQEPEDLKLYAESLPKLVAIGMKIPLAYAHEKLRIPMAGEDEEVLTPAAAGLPPAPAAAARRLAAARARDDTDELEALADELASDWERVTEPVLGPIFALAAASSSFEEFQARLPETLKEMDLGPLTETLARGQFAAAVWGRLAGGGRE